MIIDFHAHAFPDNVAEKAIPMLTASTNGLYNPIHNGTIDGLIKHMDNCSIDISVVQPIVTKQSQTKHINEWAAKVCDDYKDRIICFGSIFPHSDDYKSDIDFIVSLGLKGLKFHAEYQNFILDDKKMLDIYDYAFSKNLILLHHAGFDPAFPAPFKSNPQRFLHIVKEMRGGMLIAAHLGGHDQWDDVEEYLCGENIYLDTSMGFEYYSHEQFLRIIKKHGADKILFASDSPWSNAKTEIKYFNALPLDEIEKTAILSGNAKRILGI